MRPILSFVLLAACVPDLPGPSLSLSPAEPLTADDLVAAVSDAPDLDDRRDLTYTVRWERDGAAVTELDGQTTVPAAQTAKGQVWTAIATGVDDKERPSAATTAQVTIGDTAPVAESVVIEPDPAFTDTSLTAAATGADADGDAIAWTYTWTINGSAVPNLNSDALDSSLFIKGDVVGVSAAGTADGLSTGSVQSAAVTIRNSPPIVEQATIMPSPPTVADEVACAGIGWSDADGDAEDYLVAWEVDGAIVDASPILTSEHFGRGDIIACILTPFDGDDEGEAVRSNPILVANAPPRIAAVELSDLNPRTADTLTAVISGVDDADGDAVEFTYVWTVDGTEALRETSSATSASLPGTWFVKGERVRLTVTPHDGLDAGEPVASDEAVVANTPPTAPEAEIDPAKPVIDEDLVCVVAEDAIDADGDALTYSVTWTRDGEAWEGETISTLWDEDTIPFTATRDGEEWICAITADDGEAEGPEGTSEPVEIWAPPTVGSGGTDGVLSGGDPWRVCRADSATAWISSNSRGIYSFHEICRNLGYAGADAYGGTCGTVCGYCGRIGSEIYAVTGAVGTLTGTYSATQIYFTVNWRCRR